MTMDDYAAIHRLDEIEAAAYTAMYAAAPDALAQNMGVQVQQHKDATLLMAAQLPDGFFNRVTGLGNQQAATEADMDAIIDMYRVIGISNWWLQLSQSTQYENLLQILSNKGFEPAERPAWAKFSLSCDDMVVPEIPASIRQVKPEEAEAFGQMMCAAYGMPEFLAEWFAAIVKNKQWVSYAAFDGTNIIGGGLMFIQGKGAWLGGGGVVPEARGKHLHRLLMQARMQYAKTAGCEWLATETGEPITDEANPSLHNIEGCGFRKTASRKNFQYSN